MSRKSPYARAVRRAVLRQPRARLPAYAHRHPERGTLGTQYTCTSIKRGTLDLAIQHSGTKRSVHGVLCVCSLGQRYAVHTFAIKVDCARFFKVLAPPPLVAMLLL
eukprot:1377625-Rhodomonas_salina.2